MNFVFMDKGYYMQSQLFGHFRQSSDKDLEHNGMKTQKGTGISVQSTLRN
jgi:hypothetical protein